MKPAVILIGADKGGVGKTTVARALLDYLSIRNVLAKAYDTEHPRGTLKRFHPEMTEIVDITSVGDQMRILDNLAVTEIKVSVVDLRAGRLSTTLQVLRDVGFFDAAKEGMFTLALFHVLGPSIASLDELAEVAPVMNEAHYFTVKNFVNDTSFFDWDQVTYKKYFSRLKNVTEITIPKLNEMAYEQVEIAGVPFTEFVANKGRGPQNHGYSFVLRGYVRTWFAQVCREFDDAGLLPKLIGSSVAA